MNFVEILIPLRGGLKKVPLEGCQMEILSSEG
jgi:hypothetical protein